jgi:hypothetical protein
MSYNNASVMTNNSRRRQGPAQTQSMGSAGTGGQMAASGETAGWGRPHEYHTAPITRCVMRRRRQFTRLFWLGVDAGLLFGLTAALAYLVLVRCVAPEWLVDLEKAEKVVTREVRP